MVRLILPFLTLSLVLGQILSNPEQSVPFNTARHLEKQNRLDEAAVIYQDLVENNPGHSQAFRRLRDIYVRQNKLNDAVSLIQSHLEHFPNDTPSKLSLGEMFYKLEKPFEARRIWQEIENQSPPNLTNYRNLFNTYIRLSLEEDLVAMVHRARINLKSPQALALESGNYYYARRVYNRAITEYLLFIRYQPRQVKFVTSRILLMSDESEAQPFIETGLFAEIPYNEKPTRELLSAYYFKTQQYNKALNQHQLMGLEANDDFQRWFAFAESLRLERQFELALESYSALLSPGLEVPSKLTGQALIGLAQTFEDQILPKNDQGSLVHYFTDNVFFENHFYLFRNISDPSVQTAFTLYDSVLIKMPASSFSAQANYRLGELQYRLTRNFDGALKAYEAALRSHPDNELEAQLRIRIGDILLAQGKIEEAHNYFYNDFNRGSEFKARFIQTLVYQGEIDSALIIIDETIKSLPPMNPWFNDFLEMKDFLSQYSMAQSDDDRESFRLYLTAEMLVRQYKLSESVETLAYIRDSFPSAPLMPYVILREAILRRKLEQFEEAIKLAELLSDTPFHDKAIVLTGEIQEVEMKNIRDALSTYHLLLEKYPTSMVTEPVRLHVRELTQAGKEH
ncbi:MAG: tetratricopeptide repeat protein [Candidatus Marinimicrobia bacterium]|nr:tetratricopeptide repeat protein [Candidatus Neomarinimicrobiota bacterium]